jgi:hypothetical protein
METGGPMTGRKNAMLDLSNTPDSTLILNALVTATKGKGEGRVKCTVTKHRVAKTAILLGIQVLSKRPPSTALKLVEKWAPICKPGRGGRLRVRTELVLECSSTQGLLEGVDRVWRNISGAVSHRRVMKAALCLGLDSLNRVEPGKVRQLVSKVCPVPKKYWDPELDQWL